MKYKEIIFSILDALKLFSDDTVWEQEHIVYMIHKYRSLLIKQRFFDRKREIPTQFYQRLLIDFDITHERGYIFKSNYKIPSIVDNGIVHSSSFVLPDDTDSININFVNNNRFKYTNINKYLKNQTYATIDNDGYMYIKDISNVNDKNVVVDDQNGNIITSYNLTTSDDQYNLIYNYIKNQHVYFDSIFDNPIECYYFNSYDVNKILQYDIEFPCDYSLSQTIIDLVVKEIMMLNQIQRDNYNNANDDNSQELKKNR